VKQLKNCVLQIVIVDLSAGAGLSREQRFGVAGIKFAADVSNKCFADTQEIADGPTRNPVLACEDHHCTIAFSEPAIA